MKYTAIAVIALLTGLILGGWGPRADLKKMQAEIDSLKKQVRRSTKSTDISGVKSLLKLQDDSNIRKRAAERSQNRESNQVAAASSPNTQGVNSVVIPVGSSTNKPNLQENIKAASDLWNTRAAMARNSFFANENLTTEQQDQFENLVVNMNVQLEASIKKWVETVKEKDEIKTEDGIRVINELSGTMVSTYDEMDKTMPPGWRDKAGDEFKMEDFIDPVVAMPLVDVEDKLEKRAMEDQHHGRHFEVQAHPDGIKTEVQTQQTHDKAPGIVR